jgi:hypothetical protein
MPILFGRPDNMGNWINRLPIWGTLFPAQPAMATMKNGSSGVWFRRADDRRICRGVSPQTTLRFPVVLVNDLYGIFL